MQVKNPLWVLAHIPGWHTQRRIVVIESDDWGTIRIPSKMILESLVKKGIHVDNLPFNKFDSLESENDLTGLFEVLASVKDINGSPAIITANCVVANPDFIKIKDSNYTEYFFEPFTETLLRYPSHQGSFNLWKEGLIKGLFIPQFHGREHLNVTRWMSSLRENIGHVRLAFDNGMFDLSENMNISENSFMDSLSFRNTAELDFQKKILQEGLNLFEKLFGYKSVTFIAPNYVWSSLLNMTLFLNGVFAFQSGWFQFEPKSGSNGKYYKRFHFTGQRNSLGQLFLVRNVHFEPSLNPGYDWVGDVMKHTRISFHLRKPVIISSHRLNYIGYIDPKNRDRNLPVFKKLLKEIKKKWPDTEFMSSPQLYNLIIKGN